MQCYTELVPPSGINCALSLPFTASDASNLIVSRSSLLQIFAHKQVNNGQDTKLVLVAEYRLPGTVTSLGRVSILSSKSGGEAVLVALRDAKLSLIEWDAHQHSISTISIHYYESDDLLQCPWSPDIRDCVSRLTVDPSSRCAAFNFGAGNLAIIPFLQLGDDLAMDDYEDVGTSHPNGSPVKETNGDLPHNKPYNSSFVLPLTMLESNLLHPIDLAFLHEYREPTFGILYSMAAKSSNMLYERKDVMIYAVFTLDLEQKASTNLLSIQRLPNDLYKIIPLPLPVGGALLVGSNELIHIDQGGKSTAIGVNEFARQYSSFSMADRSEYELKLEGSQIELLGNTSGDLLMVLASGEVFVLNFQLDGRSVSSLSLQAMSSEHIRNAIQGAASCMAGLGPGRLFIGSEEGDSVLLGTAKKTSQLKRQSSRANLHGNGMKESESEGEAAEDDEGDDDDDLYGEAMASTTNGQTNESSMAMGNSLRLLDRLPSIAPLRDVSFGRSLKRKRGADEEQSIGAGSQLELAIASGGGHAGGVAFLSRDLDPHDIHQSFYDDADSVWSFPVKRYKKESREAQDAYHDHLILSKRSTEEAGESILLTISDGKFVVKEGTEFEASAGSTVEVGSLRGGNHTVQVLETEVRVWDFDFGLAQILPIVDEDSGSNAKALKASFLDPFVLILKDDASLVLLKADKSGELEELELPDTLSDSRFLSASFYNDTTNFFNTARFYNKPQSAMNFNGLMALLDANGRFTLRSLPNLDIEVFSYEALHFMPLLLASDIPLPKHWKSKDSLAEVLIADVGDRNDFAPHLIVKNTVNDVTVYQPFPVPATVGMFRFRKVAVKMGQASSDVEQESEGPSQRRQRASLRAIKDVGGFSAVFSLGMSPVVILKAASSAPRIYNLRSGGIKSLTGYHDYSCPHGFAYIGEAGQLCRSQLPPNALFGHPDWIISKVELGQDVSSIAYFERTASYVLATNHPDGFHLPHDDEWHPDWAEEQTGLPPQIGQSSLKLLSSQSHKIISEYQFESAERVTCVKSLSLEASEVTHERKDLIVVGTAIVKGENVTSRGNIYLFDVVDVAPEPGVPETDLKLKMIAKEEVKGAVTAVSEVGSQGFILAAQGQKCMVRGLKEDLTILPVAFMDMRYYVKVAKELKGTGMCILGDGFSGLWLMGYSEEPYKMQLLGRDLQDLEVQAAEFLPDGKQLYIISADGEGELHVMQYDPENPKTERGTKLLQRSTFNTGSLPTSMTLLPRTPVSSDVTGLRSKSDMDIDLKSAREQILITTQEGGLALITPLADQAYRRLSTLQNILMTNLEHPCGLNPRAYRAVETDGVGGLGMIDGNLVQRWEQQSSQHKASMADKIGGTIWDIRADLESIGGAGLGFL